MYGIAVRFPKSFFGETVFLFVGETPNGLIKNFHDVQDIECHLMNIMPYLSNEDNDFAEDIYYNRYLDGQTVMPTELKRFFELCPDVCLMLDYIYDADALNILKSKYPNALHR
jgi:hypothetical protein